MDFNHITTGEKHAMKWKKHTLRTGSDSKLNSTKVEESRGIFIITQITNGEEYNVVLCNEDIYKLSKILNDKKLIQQEKKA